MKISITKNKFVKNSLVLFAWLAVWELISRAVGQVLLVPGPVVVGKELVQMVCTSAFWGIVLTSLKNILLGFIFSFTAGIVFAFCSYKSRLFHSFISPFIQIIKAVPVASFIILALVWVPSNWLAIFIVFMMVTPMVFTNIYEGLLATDKNLLEMAKLYSFGTVKTLRYLYLPSLIPYILGVYKTGIGFAFKSAVAAEVIGAIKTTIGYQIYTAKMYLETPLVFAWTIVIVVFSILAEKLGLLLSDQIGKVAKKRGLDI